MRYVMADEVGFEPTEPFGSLVFKTSAFNHSATHPSVRAALALRDRPYPASGRPGLARLTRF